MQHPSSWFDFARALSVEATMVARVPEVREPLRFFARNEEILSGTSESHIQQVHVVDHILHVFLVVVSFVDGT